MEQRRHKRLPASLRIFARAGASRFPSEVKDITIGGAHLLTAAALQPGTESVFAVHLPHHDVPLELQGHVVWSTAVAMGVQFHASEPRLAAFLERLELDATRL